MVTANQIKSIVRDFLSHGDPNRFVTEFSRLSYNIHKHGDPEAVKLANRIECSLADVRGGLISKGTLLDSLREIAALPVSNIYSSPAVFTGGCTHPATISWAPRWEEVASSVQFVDKRCA